MREAILTVDHLVKDYEIVKGLSRRRIGTKRAVNDVSFAIGRGEILGLVGESGCGKTTVGRCIIRAIDSTSGSVLFRPQGGDAIEVTMASEQEMKKIRQRIRLVFQDPYSSLNPRMNVLQIVSRALIANGITTDKGEIERLVSSALSEVGLDPKYMRRYPHAFSGGQRQRIAIARALVVGPELVIADEPISALDVSIQAQILNLLKQLRKELNLTYLFIAHNLAVINHICDRVAVMYLGRIVEIARCEDLFARPLHPYTEALLASIPIPDPRQRREQILLQGEIADLLAPPSGCYFHPRCAYAQDICREQVPPTVTYDTHGEQHAAACHLASTLKLQGVDT